MNLYQPMAFTQQELGTEAHGDKVPPTFPLLLAQDSFLTFRHQLWMGAAHSQACKAGTFLAH